MGAVTLRAILDDPQTIPPGEFADYREISRLAVEVNRQNRGGAARRRVPQGGVKRRRVHDEPVGFDIHQHRRRAGPLDCGNRRHRGMRHGEDQIPRSDAAGAQG